LKNHILEERQTDQVAFLGGKQFLNDRIIQRILAEGKRLAEFVALPGTARAVERGLDGRWFGGLEGIDSWTTRHISDFWRDRLDTTRLRAKKKIQKETAGYERQKWKDTAHEEK
jgi:hypothetical protein